MNEIPGADLGFIDGGLGVETEPIYTIPLTDTYTVLLNGQTLTRTETTEIAQYGPGYAVLVDDINVGTATQDKLVIDSDGTQLTYRSSDSKEVTIKVALDGQTESHRLSISGADVESGQPVTLTVDTSSQQLVFNNRLGSSGNYALDIKLVSPEGGHWFVHSGLPISATDTHYLNYGTWDGYEQITLDIDHGSNGMIDETLALDNQVRKVYLPLVLSGY